MLVIDELVIDYINRILRVGDIRQNSGCVALARDMEEHNRPDDCVPLSTLKRMFVANVTNRVTRPRLHNLNAIAHYCGFLDYEHLWEDVHGPKKNIAAAFDGYAEPDGQWIYKLVRHIYREWDDNRKIYAEFKAPIADTRYFLTLTDVLNHISHNALADGNTYCYKLMQYPVGEKKRVSAIWLFAPDGKLLDFIDNTPVSSRHQDFGELKSERFKQGDIVEVMQHDNCTVKRGIIIDRSGKARKNSPDHYLMLLGPSIEDCDCSTSWKIMNVRKSLPDDFVAEVKSWLKCMLPFTGKDSTGPFSLYQDENGLWGLVDSTGQKLAAKLERKGENLYLRDDTFWLFDAQSGFYPIGDKDEVYAALNPAYLPEYIKYVIYRYKYEVPEWPEDCVPILEKCPGLPKWLRDCLIESCDPDFAEDEARKKQMIKDNRILIDIEASTDPIYDVLMSPDVSEQVKATLWNVKLKLDYELLINRKDKFR